jgi:hypothetical protein
MENRTPISFWKKPEGKTGIVVIIATIAAVIWFGGTIGPFILASIHTLTGIVLSGVALVALLYLILNPMIGMRIFQVFCRLLICKIVELDPVKNVQIDMANMETEQRKMDSEITKLASAEEEIIAEIESNTRQMSDAQKEYRSGQKAGVDEQDLQYLLVRIAGLDEANQEYRAFQQQTVAIKTHLMRVSKATSSYLRAQREQVDIAIKKFNITNKATGAIRSAMRIIQKDGDSYMQFNMAMEYMSSDVNAKMGEIKMAINASSEFLTSADIKNGVKLETGAKLMDTFDPSKYTILTSENIEAERKSNLAKGMSQADASIATLTTSRFKI